MNAQTTIDIRPTHKILVIDPEVNETGKVIGTYAVVNLAIPGEFNMHRIATQHDNSCDNDQKFARRQVISPVYLTGTGQYLVKTASGYSKLQEWLT